MPRMPRVLADGQADYHVYNRLAGSPHYFPFRDRRLRQKLLQIIRFYVTGYCCRLASTTVMDNHYHLVLNMQAYRRLSLAQLQRRARYFYPHPHQTRHWSPQKWRQFNRRLFSLSELMRNINGEYAKWFNRQMGRRGPLWADRFKSTLLLGRVAVQDAVLYTELNPVRAGLVQRPELWKWGSARWRHRGQDRDLIPLQQLFPEPSPQQAYASYRCRLLYRGSEPARQGQACIPSWILQAEQRRGFHRPGLFLKPLRFITEGLVLGRPQLIHPHLQRLQHRGYYRRRHPISHLQGLFFTLRQPRSRPRPR